MCEYVSLCEYGSCSLEACINHINSLSDFLHVNKSSRFEHKEIYVTGRTEFRED